MLFDQLLVDGADHIHVDVNGVEIEERHAEFMGRGDGDCAGIGKVFIDQVSDERNLVLLDGFESVREFVLGDDTVLHEAARQSRKNGL